MWTYRDFDGLFRIVLNYNNDKTQFYTVVAIIFEQM